MAQNTAFLGTDTQGNPITDTYNFSGDAKYTARSEDAARRFDWNMMNYQNWWNSPELQLSRMQEAGLNPLFYLGGNAGTTPAAAGGNLQGHQMTSGSGKLEQALTASKNVADTLLGTQKQALDYEIQRREQNLELKRIGLEERQVGVQEAELGLKKNKQPYEIQNLEAQTGELVSRSRFNEAQVDYLGKQGNWTEQQIAESKARIGQINANIDKTYAEIKLFAKLEHLTEAQAAQAWAQADYYNDIRWPSVEKLQAETSRTEEEVKETIAKTANFIMDTDKKEVEIEVQKGQSVVLERTAEGILIKNELDKTYGGAERVERIVAGYVGSACQVIDTGMNVYTRGLSGAVKAEVDRTKKEAQYTEGKTRWLGNEVQRRSADELIGDAQSASDNREWNTARQYRDEALQKAARATDPTDKSYWNGQADKYSKEMEDIEKGQHKRASKRSSNTDFNPTFNFGD